VAKKKKQAQPKASKPKAKAPKAKKEELLFGDDDDDDFDDPDFWQEVSEEEQVAPSLSLGQRIGTITMLETIPAESLPAVVRKAGLHLKLQGSNVHLAPGGESLTLAELKELAQWLLEEASKASEQYAIDLGEEQW
jgi:hypothetical protein